jgi:hypothetical protein
MIVRPLDIAVLRSHIDEIENSENEDLVLRKLREIDLILLRIRRNIGGQK